MTSKEFLISWSVKFPKDRIFRKKYNIPFGSEQHLNMSQIDIYLDILEDELIKKYSKQYHDEKAALEQYKTTGVWLKENGYDGMNEKQFQQLFKNLDVSKLNDNIKVEENE